MDLKNGWNLLKALPGLEPGFWEFDIRIPSDNHYTIAPLAVRLSDVPSWFEVILLYLSLGMHGGLNTMHSCGVECLPENRSQIQVIGDSR